MLVLHRAEGIPAKIQTADFFTFIGAEFNFKNTIRCKELACSSLGADDPAKIRSLIEIRRLPNTLAFDLIKRRVIIRDARTPIPTRLAPSNAQKVNNLLNNWITKFSTKVKSF
ncbi:MAG: hypothetical protein B7Z37_13945 [Verrucomicrobia bacterium 12-59-8]|nr:MAG: hypothetical protein B7Z37_13945 [Verrucomicrobia bacterium 12-59-8]